MWLDVIKRMKKEKGLTNEDLALISGVPVGTINKITAGITKDPKLETMRALANALGCSLDDFSDPPLQDAKKERPGSDVEQDALEVYNKLVEINDGKQLTDGQCEALLSFFESNADYIRFLVEKHK
ncbi:MAG: helix-turn-helix domain-containing protein [Oscillospiraceae bacterium]|nr:helix-turn-helix domain-containing protein [Oscillospiraceae bacterium]